MADGDETVERQGARTDSSDGLRDLEQDGISEADLFAAYETILTEHYEAHFGPTSMVFRDNHSDHSQDMRVNVHLYPASDDRPFLTLTTCGMGLRKMNVGDASLLVRTQDKDCSDSDTDEQEVVEKLAEDFKDFARAELLLYLPGDWDFGGPDGRTPFQLLLSHARYPYRNSTWLGVGHTVPNGAGFTPYFEGSLLAAAYFLPALFEDDEFFHFDLTNDVHLHVLWLQPITVAERHLKRTQGSHALNLRLAENDVFTLDIDRSCTVLGESRAERRSRERAQKRRRKAVRDTPWEQIVCTECYATFMDVLTEGDGSLDVDD